MKTSPHPLRRRSASVRAAGALIILLLELGLMRQPVEAGDILRGGATSGAPVGATNPTGTAPPPITPAGGSTRDSLARTAQAIQAMQAMQKAARDVAVGGGNHAVKNPSGSGSVLPDVPDGIGKGGLQVDPRVVKAGDPLWTGAELPTQTSTSGGSTVVTVKQTAQQAILNWENFNVGKNTTLKFDQSAGGANVGQWIAFNKVNDPMANPTQILGNIEAPGQVYVINRNGIVFGGSSQVNTHALVASTLSISDTLVQQGLLNNPNNTFLFSGLGGDPNTKVGDVIVEAGAKLTAPTSADKVGGRIALIGANVTNEGTLSTTDGQTILAAGLEVGLAAHASSDPSLRGLDVFIGAVVDPSSTLTAYAGNATNSGLIDSGRANITLAGKDVNQLGIITSTTSVSFNGRIDLLANYGAISNATGSVGTSPFLNRFTGTVTLGEDSVTQILPELDSTDKVIGSKLALNSQINIQGKEVHFDDNSILYAPSADVSVNAGSWQAIIDGKAVTYNFIKTDGRIDLDSGAIIDVSGSENVTSSVSSNIVAVELRGSELADSPLQRDGALRGETVYVDITKTGTYNGKTWIGTPIGDVSGYANLVQRTVGELTASGGTVKLNAGGAVVIRDGAKVDVSGGTINYKGAVVQTSRVVTADGKVIDIADATPDQIYKGVYAGGSVTVSQKFGVTEQFTNPLTLNGSHYQEGFVQGGNGGALSISSGAVAIDGTLKGTTFTGVRQRTVGPAAATLNISFTTDRFLPGATDPSGYSPNATSVVFSNANSTAPLADFATDAQGNAIDLPQDRLDQLVLSPDLLGPDGFGNLSVKTPDGNITVEQGVTLQTTPRGSIALAGANIDIQGSILSAGGTLSFTAYDVSPDTVAEVKAAGGAGTLPGADPARGNFTLGENSTLSTAGFIVDDRPGSATQLQTPLVTTGGAISVTSLSADLAAGSVIDVSGGLVATAAGKYTYGNAGSITLTTGRDATLNGVTGGHLTMGGQLVGMSGAKGGTLSLQASSIQVGGATAPADALHLNEDFFNQGGFASFNLTGIGRADGAGMLITSDAHIAPVVSSWLASANDGGGITLTSYVKDQGLRSPVSLSFNSTGSKNDYDSNNLLLRGDVKQEAGAVIDAGVSGAIKLSGQTVEVQGSLLAAGGSIQISGASSMPVRNGVSPTSPQSTVWIGSSAVIDASGTTILVPDSFGRRRGAVLDGGSISVSGNVLADSGAILDVSGASGTLDLLPGENGQSLADLDTGVSGTTSKPYSIRGKATQVDSDGGIITLAGSQMLYTDATLHGEAGGATAAAGTLALSSSVFVINNGFLNPKDPTFVLTQSGDVLPATFSSGIGITTPADGMGLNGGGHFAADRFTEGGFANLDIGGVLKVAGPVSVHASGRITAGTGPVMYADNTVSLDASYVKLGAPFKTPRAPTDQQEDYLDPSTLKPIRMAPVTGSGTLNVSGDLIDVGDLSLQGIGTANLVAANGDIRGSGTLAVAGDINLTAGQIYPPTALQFTIAAFDYQSDGTTHAGTVTITGSGKRSLPLSAGGTLAIYGSKIVQNGTLRAPFGSIKLGWDGTGTAPTDMLTGGGFSKTTDITLGAKSVTSVSAIDPITGKGVTIPYGVSLDGTTWLDPRGVDITSGGLPQKSVTLSGGVITTEDGSQVDVRGGGDLFAYRFVSGNGGSTDILASSGSFAIIPGYSAEYAPYAPYNNRNSTFGSDSGYTNSTLQVGQQIRLGAGSGVPAGVYTLLPARYALLPGAYLVTPQSGTAVGTVLRPDGSRITSGYVFNGLDSSVSLPDTAMRFEIASAKVTNARAQYTQLLANTFLTSTGGFRLPGDSGQLVLSATQAMILQGDVQSAALSSDFRGGLIDISSPGDIWITNGTPSTVPASGTLVLDANLLSGFGAESILIGGVRSADADGTLLNVTAGSLTLDNAGAALTGPEIILAAKTAVTLKDGAQIKQSGKATGAPDTLIVGKELAAGAAATGSGNGALVRVNHGAGGALIRRDVIAGGNVSLTVGSSASLAGDSILLDSTGGSQFSSTASLAADNLSLSSGRISLSLDPSVTPGADAGLVLSSATIADLSSASSLSLASYSSIDLLGAGTVGETNAAGKPLIDSLSLHAASIRALGTNGGEVVFNASQIQIGGQAGAVAPAVAGDSGGTLSFRADQVELGSGSLQLGGFGQVNFTGSKEIRTVADGSITATGGITLTGPLLTSASSVDYLLTAGGALKFEGTGSTAAVTTAGLASSLTLNGASVDLSSRIVLPSGSIVANATTGDVTVSGSLEAGGISRRFKDQTRYTNGGRIQLTSANGDVTLVQGSSLNVSAPAAAGDAGSIALSAKNGDVALNGALSGQGGANGKSGSFSLQTHSLASTSVVDALLNQSSFNESREYRVTTGDVAIDGSALAHHYALSTDSGSITVTGMIDASGKEGGSVRLVANEGLTLASGSVIDASAADFSSAGKGGSVALETRGANGGAVDLQSGAKIDLSVDAAKLSNDPAEGYLTEVDGKFTGTLSIRAPRSADGSDLAVDGVNASVTGASQVIVEGYQTYDLTSSGGAITSAVKSQVQSDAADFMTHADGIESRILGSGSDLGSILTVRPGAEIVNTNGDLTLGTATASAANGDWDLSTYRYGGEQVPGILTLRASGNLVFYNSLSDGFTSSTYDAGLMDNNAALHDNAESWSYRLVAGADFSAADTRQIVARTATSSTALGTLTGSVKLGKNGGRLIVTPSGANAKTSTLLNSTQSSPGYFQVIRTGSGDIDVVAGGDVQLLNPFASIYTAGTQVADPTLGGTFALPGNSLIGQAGGLGVIQYQNGTPIQYSLGGGDVSLWAANDIIHLTQVQDTSTGKLVYVQDSQREMPVNWLYRRGYVDPATGEFGTSFYGETASTTWWVDFTNFFEGAGALGGGNVTLTAGRDVSNVDAVAPTNARMPGSKPDASKLVELGGGDVTVTAGRNIDAGVYYVERGEGSLTAGASIITNSTRSPNTGSPALTTNLANSSTWLPTTLFVGKGSFDVVAGQDALLGPVANPFLLPQGFTNSFWNKTWFSTYDDDSSVSVSAYSGDVDLRQSVTLNGSTSPVSTLQAWFQTQLVLVATGTAQTASSYQPWLRLTETSVDPFAYAFRLMPGTLKMTSFSGDVNTVGNITLSPSHTGTLEVLAQGAINGLNSNGVTQGNRAWQSTTLNLSDADPAALPGIEDPYAYQNLAGTTLTLATRTQPNFLSSYALLFSETGSTDGALQERQVRHTAGLLHADDDNPVLVYSGMGDISGITLYSAKFARILAGQDLRDISLYLQNNSATDVSVVAAGRDIIAYDTSTSARVQSTSTGNQVVTGEVPQAGDIQIAGQGTLEVLAGRNLDLGIGSTNANGTGSGITSVGNGRNPYLPFAGANIIGSAGMGEALSLDTSKADFAAFITKFVTSDDGTAHLKEIGLTPAAFASLTSEEQKQAALKIFFLVLRDTGRNYNNPDSDQYGTYDKGKEAVATLFPGTTWGGDIATRSRSIRTRNGGDITLMAPGGSLTLAQTVIGSPQVPPGIITETGGNIDIFTDKNVELGISRIFTLRGGDEIIWSTHGDIAAGSSSKTILSAPPTRVLIDPQSGDVKTDLAGLATGGGIGVLSTVAGVEPADVDLIAPEGTIDAGDAGIRVSGNLNIAAAVVVNASNISVGGSSSGATSTVSAPSVGALTSASTAAVAAGVTETSQGDKAPPPETAPAVVEAPSDISVEVIGYGGDEGSGDDEEDKDKDKKDDAAPAAGIEGQ